MVRDSANSISPRNPVATCELMLGCGTTQVIFPVVTNFDLCPFTLCLQNLFDHPQASVAWETGNCKAS